MNAAPASPQELPMWNTLLQFADRAWKKTRVGLRFHGKGTFPNFPIPVRLPFDAWWLAWNDVVGKAVLKGSFEKAECDFLSRFLQPGMTVLDVGAHHGFYALLASRRVGNSGRVFAFEPSPRERKKLGWHLRWNRCSNVEMIAAAVGARAGQAELFVAAGRETGCNSLRLPAVRGTPEKVSVPVDTLDDFLSRRGVEHVDFLKLDVEGAELSALRGAQNLVSRSPRPVVLVEVSDLRTAAWGYAASDILKQLSDRGYRWFEPREGGWLVPAPLDAGHYNRNFVAIPEEAIDQFSGYQPQAQDEAISAPGTTRHDSAA
jgi:FkbM family methyltransferase